MPDPAAEPGGVGRAALGADSDGEGGEEDRPDCDVCGSPAQTRHCKIVCPNCGYRRDCSDP